MILGVLCLAAVIAATLTSLLSANTLTLALHFRRTFNDMALLTGWHLFGIGVAGLLFVPTARVWGKRHLYLLGLVIIVIGSIWGGSSGSSYRSLVWARVIQGVGLAPFEALLNASVGDLFFVHERGKRMALSNVALFGGAFLTPVIVGKMTHSIGWQWTFYFVAIFEGALLPVVYFLVPETSYRRPAHLNTDVAITMLGPSGAPYPRPQPAHPQPRTDKSTGLSADDVSSAADHEEPGSAGSGSRKEEHGVAVPASFGGRVALFVKLFLRPFPLFLQPAVAWACVVQGVLIGWTVLIGIVIAAVLLGPPLFFDEEKTGYMYSGAFVGAILGYIIAGLSADSSARYLIRRNRGVYEPEFRIWLVVPQLVFGCAGLYGFGVVAADTGRYGWFWLDFFFCLVVIGMVIGAVSSALYLVDAHRQFLPPPSRQPKHPLFLRSPGISLTPFRRRYCRRVLHLSHGIQEHVRFCPYVGWLQLDSEERHQADLLRRFEHTGGGLFAFGVDV